MRCRRTGSRCGVTDVADPRATPAGHEGELFGLYATTGRVASFLSPLAWSLSLAWFGGIVYGVLGIGVVLLIGLVLLLFVKLPPHVRS